LGGAVAPRHDTTGIVSSQLQVDNLSGLFEKVTAFAPGLTNADDDDDDERMNFNVA